MLTKSCPVQIKATVADQGPDQGVFEAIVSTYGVDSYKDKVVPGAFADTLAEWKASGDPIPVLWSHMSSDPDFHIGYVEQAEEREQGLWVKARLDLDAPKAAQVFRLLKGRRVTQFSFAYDIIEAAPAITETPTGSVEVLELRKLKLYEVGPTLIGVNQQTELLTAKAAIEQAVKAGRTLSQENEDLLKTAHDAIGQVLGLADQGKAKASDSLKGDTPDAKRCAYVSAAAVQMLETDIAL